MIVQNIEPIMTAFRNRQLQKHAASNPGETPEYEAHHEKFRFITPTEWALIMAEGIPDLFSYGYDGASAEEHKRESWLHLQPVLAPANATKVEKAEEKRKQLGEEKPESEEMQRVNSMYTESINFHEFIDRYQTVIHRKHKEKTGLHPLGQKHLLSLGTLYSNHRVLSKMFRYFDQDQDGRITHAEWTEGLKLVNSHMDKKIEDSEDLFKLFDFDGDGMISLNEFCEAGRLSENERRIHHKQMKALWSDLDISHEREDTNKSTYI